MAILLNLVNLLPHCLPLLINYRSASRSKFTFSSTQCTTIDGYLRLNHRKNAGTPILATRLRLSKKLLYFFVNRELLRTTNTGIKNELSRNPKWFCNDTFHWLFPEHSPITRELTNVFVCAIETKAWRSKLERLSFCVVPQRSNVIAEPWDYTTISERLTAKA